MKVLFLLPYPLHRAPSQRFRVEAFFALLKENNIGFETHTFLSDNAWKILYEKGSLFQKAWAVVEGFLRRLYATIFIAAPYNFVFVHREAAPLGPPVFEWILAKIFRKRMIYDFDDAIWIPNVTASNKAATAFKCFWKIKYICKWSYKISAGNEFIANYARQYNKQVFIVPTCVDTDTRFNQLKTQATPNLVIGWTGSHSTLPYLNGIYPVLQRLEKDFLFTFLVICNKPPDFQLRSLKFLPWKENSEIEDLLEMNIGIMPLVQDAWSEGKCGFKIIQYLALGIPAIASRVGVNKSIILEGENGFLCTTEKEWYHALSSLLTNKQLRIDMGVKGRSRIVGHYSLKSTSRRFLSLFS